MCTHFAEPATRALLTRYVSRRVRAGDVDDVVQATLCDALGSGRAPHEAPAFRRWLLAIARFKIADLYRSVRRDAAVELDELAVPPPPVEERSLARWAEHQLPSDQAARTLGWMMREADGERLETIAADERVPADRVRKRVSRLRRWMRARWIAELGAAALLTLALVGLRAPTGEDLRIVPEAPSAPGVDPRLLGVWHLVAFEPAAPLSAARAALFDALHGGFGARFDGRTLRATWGESSLERAYVVESASGRAVRLREASGTSSLELELAWEGDVLVVSSSDGPWPGVARLRR